VALGPDTPEGYVARGFIRASGEFDWTGAQADFARALEMSPDDADVMREYIASVLRPVGRGDEMVTVARKAATLDPLNPASWTMLGACLFRTGQLEPARETLERSLELNPQQAFAPGFLGATLLLQGQAASALPMFEKSTSEVFRLLGKAMTYHSLGREDDSKDVGDVDFEAQP
jgi:adenylate cyclase